MGHNAILMDVKRFAVHDGPGLRTTLFLKGCSLKCIWCHNPEGICKEKQLAYYPHKCILCGACIKACPTGAHQISQAGHRFTREKCIGCGRCEKVCLGNALTLFGKQIDVEEACRIATEDAVFYRETGGVTVSGGEPLLNCAFVKELFAQLKKEGVHTAVDTCGYVPKESIDKVLPYTDIFLYDIKAMDEDVHIKCTGKSNKLILENIKYLDALNKSIEIRIPYVPNYNDNQMNQIADFLKTLKNVTKVRVLPYHNYAGSKYEALCMENSLPATLPDEEEIKKAENIVVPY